MYTQCRVSTSLKAKLKARGAAGEQGVVTLPHLHLLAQLTTLPHLHLHFHLLAQLVQCSLPPFLPQVRPGDQLKV